MPAHERIAVELPRNVLVQPVIVEDPYEAGANIVAIRNLRDDPLGRLHAAKYIDEAQYRAGRDMEGYYERSTIGGLKAMDTTKEPVDGGGFPETLTEKIQEAVAEIKRLEALLGKIDAVIVRNVLGKGMFLRGVAKSMGQDTQLGHRYIARRFRSALEVLAGAMGYAAPKSGG